MSESAKQARLEQNAKGAKDNLAQGIRLMLGEPYRSQALGALEKLTELEVGLISAAAFGLITEADSL